MLVTWILSAAVGLLILWLLYSKFTGEKYNLPPGPKGNFILGHTLRKWLNSDFFGKTSKIHGPIFSIRVLWFNIVVVTSYDVAKEIFKQESLTGRFNLAFLKEVTGGGYGLMFAEGPLWRLHRRFTLTVLRGFGFGKTGIEGTIQSELQELRQGIALHNGQTFNPKNLFAKAVSNVINSIVFDERCSEDPDFECMVEVASQPVRPQAALFAVFWPIVKHLPGDFLNLKKLRANRDTVTAFLAKKYKRHVETFDPGNIRDYIDAYLLEARSNSPELFPEEQVTRAVFDLFLAGMETMTTTLSWVVIYLAKYPDVQRKLFEEISQTIGVRKLPETGDRTILKYTDAFCHEVLRHSSVIPFTIPRRATESLKIGDYDIPKNTMVICDLLSVNTIGPWWKDPFNFNLQNFLDDQGNLINSNYLMAFGAGKRACLGESLARQETFLFTCGLVQQFEFIANDPEALPMPDQCEKNTIFRRPPDFKIIAVRRDLSKFD